MPQASSRSRETELYILRKDVDYIAASIKEIHTLIANDYVKRSEFNPVREIVMGAVKLVLSSFVLSVIAFVMAKSGVL